ncbi:MAG: HAMP domain-containing sensor histidine kinase [Eubacteriales bacterium]|nr:HAMP domain-containing sensor histidine kinase [Eubacteriales bacterium]
MILYIIIAILVVALIILFVNNRKIHNAVDRLTDSIEDFIDNDTPTQFSTSDNHFARLQNAVNDLEELYHLEQSNTAKKSKQNIEFVSDVSHQLKTPLAGMRLYVEMDNETNPSEHTEKELILIEKMENLIYKLLRLEKIKGDSYTMDFKLESFADLSKEIVAEFQPMFPAKTYTVVGDSNVRMDKAWMYEAIANIVKNASEHTNDNGKIEITIEDSEKSTNISIKDNGGGVSKDDLPKLFSRFHRTDNANPNSAGIGLAITKAIIDKHHGTITAENTKEGLNIIICLPHIDGYITI